MSISMDRFEATGEFLSYDPFALAPERIPVFQLQCRSCGYEPDDSDVAPKVCPKCRGQKWERFARPGSILENADRY